MHAALRPYVTAGVAMVGASVIAAAPIVAPPTPAIQIPVESHSVALSADTDVLTRWVEAFNTASNNATTLSQFFFEAPGAALQQAVVNQVGYLGDVLNDPASVGTVFQTIGDNLQKAFQAATMQGLPDDINDPGLIPVLALSNNSEHTLILALFPTFLPADTPEFVTPLLHFLASPVSGVLIGFAGPLISPAVAALNSIQAGDLLNLPANVVDGFLNGATLNLDAVAPLINGAGVLPEGTTFDSLGLTFGGLFSPGATANTVGGEVGTGGVGGSIFNSLGLSITTNALGFPITLNVPGVGIGPIGALANLSQMTAGAIGWNGTGNPLTNLELPEVDQSTTPPVNQLASFGVINDDTTGQQQLKLTTSPPVDGTGNEGAGAEEDADLHVKTNGATDLSDGNIAVPGKAGTSARRSGERLRTAFEGTVDRIEKGFDDAVKGFDNALKGLSGRDKADKADKGGADTAGVGAGAGAGAGAGTSNGS